GPGPRAEQRCQDRGADEKHRDLQRPECLVRQLEEAPVGAGGEQQEVPGPIAPPLLHQNSRIWATMRRRIASSGSGSAAAARFSRTWSIRVVAGIATVTAGWERMNFKMNWAQLEAPISSTQPGSATHWNRRISAFWRNGRLTITAMPRSRASGRSRSSGSRSRML